MLLLSFGLSRWSRPCNGMKLHCAGPSHPTCTVVQGHLLNSLFQHCERQTLSREVMIRHFNFDREMTMDQTSLRLQGRVSSRVLRHFTSAYSMFQTSDRGALMSMQHLPCLLQGKVSALFFSSTSTTPLQIQGRCIIIRCHIQQGCSAMGFTTRSLAVWGSQHRAIYTL